MAIPDVVDAAKDADLLIFVVPHQFVRTICSTLLGKIKPTAAALSLIKVHLGRLTTASVIVLHFAGIINIMRVL